MNKEDAIAYLMSIDFATQNGNTNAEVEAALFEAIDKRAVKPAKTKAVKAKPTMESIKAKVTATKAAPKSTVSKAAIVAQMEDAPY